MFASDETKLDDIAGQTTMKRIHWFLVLFFIGISTIGQAAPSATTTNATSITPTNAVLNGTVTPHGGTTDVYFEWGTETNYGNTAIVGTLSSGNSSVDVTAQINDLLPGVLYHFRTVATNRQGIVFGEDQSFVAALFASATALPPSDVTPQTATLNGTFTANGNDTVIYFEWGSSSNLGTLTVATNIGTNFAAVVSSASITGLSPATEYFFRAFASNRFGVISGDLASFTTTSFATATTFPATDVTGHTSTLNGSVAPNGAETVVWFEWGATTNFGNATIATNIGSNGVSAVSVGISGLDAATTYYFRTVASNRFSVVNGQTFAFTTQAPAAVTTSAASDVTINSATLNGTVTANGNETTVYFEWGWDNSFGYTTTNQLVSSDGTNVSVSAPIVDLLSGNTYYFRLVATNSVGVSYGDTQQLTCLLPAIAVTEQPSGKTNNSAVLNGKVTTFGLESGAYFEWGITTNYENQTAIQSIPGASTNFPVSATLSNLVVGTVYYYRIAVTNVTGIQFGDGLSFVAPGPIVTTTAASDVTATNATLRCTINPSGEPTYYYFQWGTATNYGSVTPTVFAGSDTNTAISTSTIIGLTPNTTYYYRIVATNLSGVAYGDDIQFTTTGEPLAYTVSATVQPGGMAILRGEVLPNQQPANCYIRWGRASGTLTNSTPIQVVSEGTNRIPITATVSNLVVGTNIYHQMVASNSLGTSFGATVLTIVGDAPLISSVTKANVTSNSVYLIATVTPYMSGSGYFEYGLTTNYGSKSATTFLSSGGTITFSNLLSQLQSGTVYHFRAVATNSIGSTFSADQTFMTRADPIVVATGATGVGLTNATLGGTVNANGLATTVYMEYGPSTNYGGLTTFTNIGTNKFSVTVNQTVTNLTPGLVYNYRVVAANASATVYSSNRTFSTSAVFTNQNIFSQITSYLQYGGSAVADFNNDGKLDIIYTGSSNGIPVTSIRLNSRVDQGKIDIAFTNLNTGLPGLIYSSVACADFNNDGRIDVAVNGRTNTSIQTGVTRIYRNDGGGIFTDISVSLIGTFSGSVSWCDFNSDGQMDLFVCGQTNSASPSFSISQLYQNNGNGTFTPVSSLLPNLAGKATWEDYNNDGYPDVALSGVNTQGLPGGGGTNICAIYRNTGSGTFTNIGNLSTYVSTMAWGDYDADGKSDIFVSGATNLYPYTSLTRVYRNTGGAFADSGIILTNFKGTVSTWGDYNSDGLLDILYNGDASAITYPPQLTCLFAGQSGGTFIEANSGITNIVGEGLNWADFDSDGKLDVFIVGKGYYSGFMGAYKNLVAVSNAPPTAPTNLNMFVVGNRATFQWNAASDAQTPSAGLTYNLRIGTTPGGDQIVSSLAATNGARRVAGFGNVGHAKIWTINNLPAYGTFYWTVQSIDNGFAGSPFATEQKFVITGPPTITVGSLSNLFPTSVNLRAFIDANGFVSGGRFEWGTTTNYGSSLNFGNLATNAAFSPVSAIIGLTQGTTYHWRVIATNSAGTTITSDQVFTAPVSPSVNALFANNIMTNRATVTAAVNPNGATTAVSFRYGLTPLFGISSTTTTITGTNQTNVSYIIAGLQPNTTYYYCTVATNGGYSFTSTTSSFRTLAIPTLVRTTPSAEGAFAFQFTGTSGMTYDIYSSSNLVDWLLIDQLTVNSNGLFSFEDPGASNELRFYRVSSPSVQFPP